MVNETPRFNECIIIILVFLIEVAGRCLPHLPNVTPVLSLSIFAASRLSLLRAISVTFLGLFISDILLAHLNHISILGSWSLFTYSGVLLITLMSSNLPKTCRSNNLLLLVLTSAFGFWLWTNFGTWLLSGIYTWNIKGLVNCYFQALPFLRNEMLGDLCWATLIFGIANIGRRLTYVLKFN